jgi:hypothetical protein
VDPGRYDVIINPQNLWLTIHESIGHPTELDRAMGYEANFTDISFVAPPEKMLRASRVLARDDTYGVRISYISRNAFSISVRSTPLTPLVRITMP